VRSWVSMLICPRLSEFVIFRYLSDGSEGSIKLTLYLNNSTSIEEISQVRVEKTKLNLMQRPGSPKLSSAPVIVKPPKVSQGIQGYVVTSLRPGPRAQLLANLYSGS